MRDIIKINRLTKAYPEQRGVFDIDLRIKQGQVVGIVGKNGAGKTTLMRLLMGFIKSSSGSSQINGLDSWAKPVLTKKLIGYVPGEIAFPDTKTGETFLKTQLKLLKVNKSDYINHLIQLFKIDTTANIKRMSKGMKQKVALVCAFMTKPQILLLDEPTTGLDPVMRDAFIDLVLQVKSQGTTVFLSSHMFNELETTCDSIAFLKDGRIIDILDKDKFNELHRYQRVTVYGKTDDDYKRLLKSGLDVVQSDYTELLVTLLIHENQINKLLEVLQFVTLKNIDFSTQTLDNYFEKELQVD